MTEKKLLLINLIIFITIGAWCFVYFYQSPLFNRQEWPAKEAAAENENEKIPPVISKIKIDGLSATSTSILWETNEDSDSMVNYNIRKDYGIVRDPLLKKSHQLVVPELLPDQLYYFRIISSDADGNQSISNDFTFTTQTTEEEIIGAPGAKEEEESKEKKKEATGKDGTGDGTGEGKGDYENSELIKKTLSLLEEVSDEEGLSLIESKIKEMASEKIAPPVISGDFAKVDVGADYAIIKWKTDKEANSIVALAIESDFNPRSSNPYLWKAGEPDKLTLNHEVYVGGLRPATTYHYQVSSKTELGLESKSDDNTFRTKSVLPEIYNINIVKVEEDAATIAWTTNVPCSAIVEYTDLNTKETKMEGSTALVTTHSIRLEGLKFDTYYSAVIKVENEQAEKAVSDPLTFVTIKDQLPPVISKISTESTLYPGAENRTQTIISWFTDEPSACQFFYHQGLTASEGGMSELQKETDYTGNHTQVVTVLKPATVYKFWIECEDKTANKAKSDGFTLLTPIQERSIIELIISNFEGTFGWLKKVGK